MCSWRTRLAAWTVAGLGASTNSRGLATEFVNAASAQIRCVKGISLKKQKPMNKITK